MESLQGFDRLSKSKFVEILIFGLFGLELSKEVAV